MSSRMGLHRAEQATWSTTYVTCFYSAPCAGDLVLRSLSLLSWRRASPSQPEFVVAASVARLGRLLQCCFAVVDARGTRMAIDADARPEKHDGRVELVPRVVPVASRDEGHRPTRAHVHPGRSDGRSGCCHRATQEHEFHLESSHYEIFDLEIDLAKRSGSPSVATVTEKQKQGVLLLIRATQALYDSVGAHGYQRRDGKIATFPF